MTSSEIHQVVEGEAITLSCPVTGNPAPNVTWSRKDVGPVHIDNRISVSKVKALLDARVGLHDPRVRFAE